MIEQNAGRKEEKMTTEKSVYDFRVEGHSKIFKTIDEAIEYCDDNYPYPYSSIVQFKDGKKNPDYCGDDIEDGQGRCSVDGCKATKNLFMMEDGVIVCCGDCEENPDSNFYEPEEEESKEESKEANYCREVAWEKMEKKMKDNYETALAFAWGKSSGMESYSCDIYSDDSLVKDLWNSLQRDYIREEWRVKIFMDIHEDYVIYNGNPIHEDEFEGYGMMDVEGEIQELETGEYVSQEKKKKFKLNVVKK